jgi:hypothetical protein
MPVCRVREPNVIPSQNGLCDRHMVRMSYVERAEKFGTALSAAESGIDADRVLTGMLSDPALDMRERKLVVAALGRTRGPEGLAAARRTFSTAWENYPRASKSALCDRTVTFSTRSPRRMPARHSQQSPWRRWNGCSRRCPLPQRPLSWRPGQSSQDLARDRRASGNPGRCGPSR